MFKGNGDPADPAIYRPINITEALCRLAEVVVWQRVNDLLLASLHENKQASALASIKLLFILDTTHH